MCGIVGAITRGGPVLETLVEGLRVLEYRGYDSCGVAVASPDGVDVRRKMGRLAELEAHLEDVTLADSPVGIGHTRWATHGVPSDENAHPHSDGSGRMALVHNGIIENYLELRRELVSEGCTFLSETDTEVLSHLVGRGIASGESLFDAVREALGRVEGYYAMGAISKRNDRPELVCARQGPPLVVGWTEDACYLASDVLAILAHTRQVVFLEDGDIARLEPGNCEVFRPDGTRVERELKEIHWDAEAASKGGYSHHMLKEIHEQPDVIARTAFDRILQVEGDVSFEGTGWDEGSLRGIDRVQVIACGTALHAGMIARYMIEGLAKIPTETDYASEFRYREPCIAPNTMALAISQSGETADTLAGLRLAVDLGARPAAICNVIGSTLVRECATVALTHAGPEIGVASTKAFTAQVIAAFLMAVRLGRVRGALDVAAGRELLDELRRLRPKVEALLTPECESAAQAIAARYKDARGFFFLGRGVNYPVALEGALKLKEISYVHAEGYAAGEMKHGPIAMIEEGMPVVVVNSPGRVPEKTRSNIEQVKARGGHVICVGSDPESLELADHAIEVPATCEWLSPILNVIPMQLLSFHHALLRGCDIDKPRNLAKSVTVE